MSDHPPCQLQVQSDQGPRSLAYLKTPRLANARPGLVWLPGFKSVMTSLKACMLADFAAKSSMSLTRFDYSGHGASDGVFEDGTIGLWLEDASTIVTQLTDGPQILVGSSMGGWLAVLLAEQILQSQAPGSKKRIAGLVLIAPAIDMTELIKKRMTPEQRLEMQTNGQISTDSPYDDAPFVISQNLLHEGERHCFFGRRINVACPVHVLHGLRDEDISPKISQSLITQLHSTKVTASFIKDGNHRLSRPQDLALLRHAISHIQTQICKKDES